LHLVGIYMTSITKMHGTMNIKFLNFLLSLVSKTVWPAWGIWWQNYSDVGRMWEEVFKILSYIFLEEQEETVNKLTVFSPFKYT